MAQPGFELRHEAIRDHPDAALVTVDGSIDPKSVNRLKDGLDPLATRGVKRFLVDCAKLTYVNSSGLAYLLNLASGVKAKGGMVALAAVDSKILVIFNMMGITPLFTFYPSIAAALKELDEKLARELQDVGPALKLDDAPKPVAAPTPKPMRATPAPSRGRGTDRIPRSTRSIPVIPPANPIVRFFRALFGLEDTGTITFIRRKRKR